MAYFVFALMTVGLFGSTSATGCKSSTVGREFVFGILDMIDGCCHDSRNIIAFDITNVSPNDTRVRLQIPYFNNDTYFNIPSSEKKTFIISPDIQRDGTFQDSRGIKITSEGEISVLVSNAFNSDNNVDTYNILPITEIGNHYFISSYKGIGAYRGSGVLVAGVTNNTNVTILNGTMALQSVVLNTFAIFQYVCGQCDLTGIQINASENVYIVSGSTYTGIPSGSGEYIASEMLPTSTWLYNYIVAPVLPKSAYMIRIISQSSFDVIISNLTRTYRFSATSTDLYFGKEALAVTAKRPFSITQYGVNNDGITGDPFMAAVPAVEQYINNYAFAVPHVFYGNMKHYVAVIVPEINTDGLVLDGNSLQLYNITSQIKILRVPAPFDNYTILTFQVNEGYHHFYHSSKMVNFGVFLYGHGYSSDMGGLSYGFYAGFNLKGDCSTTATTSTATTYSTSTSNRMSPTLSQSTSTHVQSTTQSLPSPAKGPMCYNCDDLTHIGLCDNVHECKRHEVCYIERYRESGQMKYISGCLEADKCPITRNESRYMDALCFECCHGDYCNNKGCGEKAIPDRKNRGPICFDCKHVASPDECQHVTPCDSHQGCSIEQFKWFDYSHFKLGCGHVLCHPASRMGSHVFKRATPVCHSCCTEDYCNQNCTASSQGQTGSVIIGLYVIYLISLVGFLL